VEVVLETARRGGRGYRSDGELRVQLRHGAADSVPDGRRL